MTSEAFVIEKLKELGIQNYGNNKTPLFKADDVGNFLGIKKIRNTLRDVGNEHNPISIIIYIY
jgi:hypothetical protein